MVSEGRTIFNKSPTSLSPRASNDINNNNAHTTRASPRSSLYDKNGLQSLRRRIASSLNQQKEDKKKEKHDKEHRDEIFKQRTINKEKLDKLAQKSHICLYSTSSVFPFDFFPDHLTIESNQINVINCNFFYSENIKSVPLKNVADVILSTSLFFAKLTITDITYVENSAEISYLRKDAARKARRIIQGLVIASKEGINFSQLDTVHLAKRAEELGMAREFEEKY